MSGNNLLHSSLTNLITMKNKELTIKIIEILKEKARLTPQEIAYQVEGSPMLIQVHGVLSAMKNKRTVHEVVSERIRYYSLVTSCKDDRAVSTRNLSKFSFDGVTNLSKGRLALSVVRKFVTDTSPTLKQLKTMFPDEIVKPYGVIKSVVDALELSPDPKRKRYFLNDEDIILLSKGKIKKVCVTNQWTNDRFTVFMKVVEEKLSYHIEQK